MDKICILIGSAFGLGLLPIAPGTFGALLGLLIHVLVFLLLPEGVRFSALFIAFFIVCLVHFLLTPWAIRYWKDKDPKNFVLDEVAGYLMVPLSFRYGALWQVAVYGFILFRIIDILKVPPARQIDRSVHGAWGILLDDLVSAGYTVVVLHMLRYAGIWFNIERYLVYNHAARV